MIEILILILLPLALCLGLPTAALGCLSYALALDMGAEAPEVWGYGGGAFGAMIGAAWAMERLGR